MTFSLEPLTPATYRRQPWKNGGGISTTIAAELRAGATGDGWSDIVWQLGRTHIVTPAPFSDLTGFERMQVVVGGRGLVLVTSTGEIDVRAPDVPVRYDGGTPIVSRLEHGPVEVVNLIARHDACRIDLAMVAEGDTRALPPAEHILYAPHGDTRIKLDGSERMLLHDHALRLRGGGDVACTAGTVLVATIARV